jgi:WD40 repeat protein
LRGHGDGVFDVLFDSRGFVVSRSQDGTKKIWKPEVRGASVPLASDLEQIYAIAVSPDGEFIAAGDREGTLVVWRASTGELLPDWERKCGCELCAVFFTRAGRHLVAASLKAVHVWDFERGTPVAELARPGSDYFYSAAASPDGGTLALGLLSGTVLLWDFASETGPVTLREKTVTAGKPADKVAALAFLGDGNRLVSGSWNRSLSIWDLASRSPEAHLEGHEAGVESVDVHPDGKCIVSGSQDKTLRIWKKRYGTWRSIATCYGHEGKVFSTCFSPDGSRIISGSLDGSLRVWDPETGDLLATLWPARKAAGGIRCVTFTPDGERVISCAGDEIRIWESDSRTLQRIWEGVAGDRRGLSR